MEGIMTEISDNRPIAIKVSGVKKMYKLGQIGGGTLKADMQSWWAKKRGKEDPNSKIGEGERSHGDTFMALNGIDLTVYQGEAVGIIGSNGAGKSTLLKLLSRVTAPTEGDIDIFGRIASMLEVGTGFNGELTGRENVYMNGAILGMTKQEIDAKMEQIIEFSEVREFIDTPVKRYSSGMFVKLAFSVAAHLDAEIMIMDEVLAVGDMAFQKKCLTKMREAAKQDGRTVLYVSHNMNTIRQLCDRCIVLDKGKVVFNGDVEDGIWMYLGSENMEFPIKYNLENTPRPSKQHGRDLVITEFAFLAQKEAMFKRSKPIQFRITFIAKKAFAGLKLYIVLSSKSNSRFGMTQTLESLKKCEAGKIYNCTFEFEPSNLVEDEYYFYPDIFTFDDCGNHLSVDHPMQKISFRLIDDLQEGLKWQTQYYGNVRLNNLRLLSERIATGSE